MGTRITTQSPELQQLRDLLNGGTKVSRKEDVMTSVYRSDQRCKYMPDEFAEGLLRSTFPKWMPARLRRQAIDALRGFDEDMALEIADDLMDFYTYGVRHYIGIDHVDSMLYSLYNKFQYRAKQKGITLPGHF